MQKHFHNVSYFKVLEYKVNSSQIRPEALYEVIITHIWKLKSSVKTQKDKCPQRQEKKTMKNHYINYYKQMKSITKRQNDYKQTQDGHRDTWDPK